MTLCACGCGGEVNSGRFLQGHGRKGHTQSPSAKDAIAKSHFKYPTKRLANMAKLEKERNTKILQRRKPKPILSAGFDINEHYKTITNPDSSIYLGCYISERLIYNLFDGAYMMTPGNHGYDIVFCDGYKIDVKSSATGYKSNRWTFHINKNTTADCFALLAFESRQSDPVYLWMVPGNIINNSITTTIYKTDVYKWQQYEYPIDDVIIQYKEIMNIDKSL